MVNKNDPSETEHPVIKRMKEFERTFEGIYHRLMTPEEQRTLRSAMRIMRERLQAQADEAAD